VVPESVEKIFQIDEHIGATASGILSDARVLISRSQLKAQQYKVTYDSPIDVLSVVKDLADLKQLCTQSGGLRPFGVSVLVAGVDVEGVKLYQTDPTGIFFAYNATVIGEGEQEVEEILHKEYKKTLTIKDGMKLAMKALKQVIGKDMNSDRIDCAFISSADKSFTRVTNKELDAVLASL